jgi:hypothetical protein
MVRLLVMSLLYGFVYGVATIVPFASLGRASWSQFPGLVTCFILLFFVGWGAIFRPSWNRRAARLAGETAQT